MGTEKHVHTLSRRRGKSQKGSSSAVFVLKSWRFHYVLVPSSPEISEHQIHKQGPQWLSDSLIL